MKNLLILLAIPLFLISCSPEDDLDSSKQSNSPIYLDANGVTIKAYEWAEVGDKGIINGDEYTIVDETTLRQMIANDEDVTKVVTSKITDMNNLLNGYNLSSDNRISFTNSLFNQDISRWDTSNVTDMSNMFASAIVFDQDISKWNTSNVANMKNMFRRTVFNQYIGDWDVSNVKSMYGMFRGCVSSSECQNSTKTKFNQYIGDWDVSNVNDMSFMFVNAEAFNQNISNWDVSSVIDMKYMFSLSNFNINISNWDVRNVVDFSYMFYYSTSFNQDLSSWCVTNLTAAPTDFDTGATAWTLPKPVWGTCPE